MHLSSTWAKATLAVLTVFATVLQIGSWIWPTSRDWINQHGLVVLAWSIVLLIALSVALWRQPAPVTTPPPATEPHGSPQLTGRDRELLTRLYREMPPDAVLKEQLDGERADALYGMFVQTIDPNLAFDDRKLEELKGRAITNLYMWKVGYALPESPSVGIDRIRELRTKQYTAEVQCKSQYGRLWQRAKALGY